MKAKGLNRNNPMKEYYYENISINISTNGASFFISGFAATDFDTLDVDGNGAISQAEASVDAELLSKFEELDTNQDGELSEDEFSKA